MSGALDIEAIRARHPEAFRSMGRLRWAILAGFFGYLFYLMWLFDFDRVFTSLVKLWVIVRLMLDWSGIAEWDHAELWRSMLETVAMAYLGTMLAVVFATMVAASASTARSASTLRISGWSIR